MTMFKFIKALFCRHKNKKVEETAKGIYWYYQRFTDCEDCGKELSWEFFTDDEYKHNHIKTVEDMKWERLLDELWEAGTRQRQVDKWNKLEQSMLHETPS